MTGEELKAFIKERGLNYREFGELVGYGEDAISKAARTGNISAPMARAVELLAENEQLKKKAQVTEQIAQLVADIIRQKAD